jgi:hypothetical protein
MGDSVPDKDDDVWYPTEDSDEMDNQSNNDTPQAGFASHSNLHTSKFPIKSPVIYSASTYMINNKRKEESNSVNTSERPAEISKIQINNPDKKRPAQFTTLNVATVNNSPIFNVQKSAKQQQTRPIPTKNFYAQQPTHTYQQNYIPAHPLYATSHHARQYMITPSEPMMDPYRFENQQTNYMNQVYHISPQERFHIEAQHQQEYQRQMYIQKQQNIAIQQTMVVQHESLLQREFNLQKLELQIRAESQLGVYNDNNNINLPSETFLAQDSHDFNTQQAHQLEQPVQQYTPSQRDQNETSRSRMVATTNYRQLNSIVVGNSPSPQSLANTINPMYDSDEISEATYEQDIEQTDKDMTDYHASLMLPPPLDIYDSTPVETTTMNITKPTYNSPIHKEALDKYYKGIDYGNALARKRSQAAAKRDSTKATIPPNDESVSSNTRSQSQQLKDTLKINENKDDDISTYHVSALTMTRRRHPYNADTYIIDTGCIGSHVLKNTNLVSKLSEPTIKGVKDFSGTRHAPSCSGQLLNTGQKVLVMDNAKVNLISTQQIFKDKRASCAIINEHNFVFLDETLRPILSATNPGDGSYVCTSTALVQDFGDTSKTTNARFLSTNKNNLDTRAYTLNDASASPPSNSLTLPEIVQGLTDPTFYPTN